MAVAQQAGTTRRQTDGEPAARLASVPAACAWTSRPCRGGVERSCTPAERTRGVTTTALNDEEADAASRATRRAASFLTAGTS